MKKIFSLILVMTIVLLSASSAFAALPSSGNGLYVTMDEDATGLITGSVYLVGSLTNVSGFNPNIVYNKAKYNVVDVATKSVPVTAQVTGATALAYADKTGSAMDANWGDNAAKISYGTTSYIGIAFQTVASMLTTSSQTLLYKFYVKRATGNSAALVASDFVISTSSVTKASIVYSGSTYTNNSDNTKFGITVTPYVPAVTTKTVTYATTGSTSGTAPTQADTAPAATFTVAGAGSLVKTGYTLTGWNDGSADYAIGATYTMPSANVTFTPVWTLITVADLPIVAGDVVKGEGNHGYKNDLGQTISGTVKAVALPGKVPATIVDQASVDANTFGIEFGGKFFPSKATYAGLAANGGKFIIKLVDPTGKLTGKTFKVYNVFNGAKSASIDVVGE